MNKNPADFIAKYGSGWRLQDGKPVPDFAKLEARMLSYYSDCDPRNHYGKFANRRFG